MIDYNLPYLDGLTPKSSTKSINIDSPLVKNFYWNQSASGFGSFATLYRNKNANLEIQSFYSFFASTSDTTSLVITGDFNETTKQLPFTGTIQVIQVNHVVTKSGSPVSNLTGLFNFDFNTGNITHDFTFSDATLNFSTKVFTPNTVAPVVNNLLLGTIGMINLIPDQNYGFTFDTLLATDANGDGYTVTNLATGTTGSTQVVCLSKPLTFNNINLVY